MNSTAAAALQFALIAATVHAQSPRQDSPAWRAIGPISAGRSLKSAAADHSLERRAARDARAGKTTAFERSLEAGGQSFDWTTIEATTTGTALDLRALLSPPRRDAALAFLHCQIESRRERRVAWQLRHDDAVRIWLNGEPIYTDTTDGPKPARAVELALRAGSNSVLVKSQTDGGAWTLLFGPGERVPQQEVDQAIDDGVAWLKRAQYVDGSWGYRREHNDEPGHVAFTAYTLLRCGVPVDDPVLQRAFAFLANDHSDVNYSLCAMVLALCARDAIDMARVKALIAEIEGLIAPDGLVRYSIAGKNSHMRADLSNAIFTALAFRDASRAGIKISKDSWIALTHGALAAFQKRAAAAGKRKRRKKGGPTSGAKPAGFSYTPGAGPYGSMTVSGIAILSIARDALGSKLPRALRQESARASAAGFAWLDQHMKIDSNPERDPKAPNHHYYWLWGLERLGSIETRAVLGKRDWYQEGARLLVDAQKDDGSWAVSHSSGTQLALLFLKRASTAGPTTGNDSAARRPGVFVTDNPEAEVAIQAFAKDAITATVTAAQALPAGGQIVRAAWFAESTGAESSGPNLEEPSRPFAVQEAGPNGALALSAVSARFAPQRNGQWKLRVELSIALPSPTDGVAASTQVLSSPPLAVEITEFFAKEDLAFASDHLRDLISKADSEDAAVATCSSEASNNTTPMRALDGLPYTHWMWKSDDRAPWIELRLRKKTNASRILLTTNAPRLGTSSPARPAAGLLQIGDLSIPFVIDPDPRRKTVIELPQRTSLRTLRISITDLSNGQLGKHAGGFSLIEAQR